MKNNSKLTAKMAEIAMKFYALEKMLDEMPNQNVADILRDWSADVQQMLKTIRT